MTCKQLDVLTFWLWLVVPVVLGAFFGCLIGSAYAIELPPQFKNVRSLSSPSVPASAPDGLHFDIPKNKPPKNPVRLGWFPLE